MDDSKYPNVYLKKTFVDRRHVCFGYWKCTKMQHSLTKRTGNQARPNQNGGRGGVFCLPMFFHSQHFSEGIWSSRCVQKWTAISKRLSEGMYISWVLNLLMNIFMESQDFSSWICSNKVKKNSTFIVAWEEILNMFTSQALYYRGCQTDEQWQKVLKQVIKMLRL